MKSFLIGKIIEPEVRRVITKEKGEERYVCDFGLLSGRTCTEFQIWNDSKMFLKVSDYEDGDLVLAVVNSAVDEKGQFRFYLREIGACPEGLREELVSIIREQKQVE